MRSPKIAPKDELHHRMPAAGATPTPGRRKGTASREWLVVSDSGRSYLEEVGKQWIMRRTRIPARDLRLLDPQLSYPSTILGRERAIVINLEHIKAIITATEVLIPNSKDPMVAPFVQDLQSRVSVSYGAPQQAAESSDVVGEAMARDTSKAISKQSQVSTGKTPEGSLRNPMDASKDGGTKVLPFEFMTLELCLESACRCLESETLTLEKEAYPALDELTSKVSTLNLENVRQIKSRLVAISGRVQKVRDELEHLLDDDMDMAEMYLSEKLARQQIGESSSRVDIDHDEVEEDRDEDFKDEINSSHGSFSGFKSNIDELEMLLEAYFVQIDGTLNKLSHLREYVDDTEDYINIMLDDKQNQLLQMGIMITTANMITTAGVVVTGIFGINIIIDLFNAPYIKFWEATFGIVGGCIVLYVLAILLGKKSGLLQ